ncbi:hypothetical protein PVK06_013233 [Gossypium arboreum]|uniref:Zinc finger CCCH domain-containing protein 44-like n=2 Tax=Gossypium arboreum TaxID=29729 RepID=A0ABR0QEP8_GOSAR|nr:hypothetical protein PVK06_013233 [Gossypium arboreum]
MARKNTRKKEEIAEDYCFFCKDGGLLRVCDYKNCLKSFHPQCVGRDDSLLETDERWFCGWHFCFICSKPAKFHCFCCPSAICGRCLCDVEFAIVKGKRAFCNTCLELALLIEDKKNVNANGVKVDFNDRETYEFLFKGYWEWVKEKEGLTLKQLHSSDRLLKDGKNYDFQMNCNHREEDTGDFEDDSISEGDDWADNQARRKKETKGKLSLSNRKRKSKKMEYIGWASKQLTEFLIFVGKDVKRELSQYDVATIVTEYCKENKLFHPEKKKTVICDERLQSLLGRKSVNRNGIYKLLTVHFSENLEQSEDSVCFSSKEDDNISVPCNKRQRKSSPDWKFEEQETATSPSESCLAAIVSRNIKLIYLKKSLVLELAQLDTFYDKMVGSFVRVKSDPNDYFQKNSHMLVQVKGIKDTSMKENTNSTILLQVSNMVKDIPVCKLSDDDFTEEEIDDLNRRMRTRMLERPTVLDLEQKARSLHEDITKHWITKELALLRSQINRANEKGWRRELSEYMYKMQLLQTPSEQSRLIHEVPEVVAESEPSSVDSPREYREEHKASLEPIAARSVSKIQKCSSENNVVPCCQNDGMNAAEGKQQDLEKPIISGNQNSQQVSPSWPGTSVLHLSPQEESNQHKDGEMGEKLPQPVDIIEHSKLLNRKFEVIELSDDETEHASPALSHKTLQDHDCSIWYCIGPQGNTKGPYSMKVLKQWSESSSSCYELRLRFKVFKSGQRPEDALLLTDAIQQHFNC